MAYRFLPEDWAYHYVTPLISGRDSHVQYDLPEVDQRARFGDEFVPPGPEYGFEPEDIRIHDQLSSHPGPVGHQYGYYHENLSANYDDHMANRMAAFYHARRHGVGAMSPQVHYDVEIEEMDSDHNQSNERGRNANHAAGHQNRGTIRQIENRAEEPRLEVIEVASEEGPGDSAGHNTTYTAAAHTATENIQHNNETELNRVTEQTTTTTTTTTTINPAPSAEEPETPESVRHENEKQIKMQLEYALARVLGNNGAIMTDETCRAWRALVDKMEILEDSYKELSDDEDDKEEVEEQEEGEPEVVHGTRYHSQCHVEQTGSPVHQQPYVAAHREPSPEPQITFQSVQHADTPMPSPPAAEPQVMSQMAHETGRTLVTSPKPTPMPPGARVYKLHASHTYQTYNIHYPEHSATRSSLRRSRATQNLPAATVMGVILLNYEGAVMGKCEPDTCEPGQGPSEGEKEKGVKRPIVKEESESEEESEGENEGTRGKRLRF